MPYLVTIFLAMEEAFWMSLDAPVEISPSTSARKMVTKYGMSDALGTIHYGSDQDEVFIGRSMAQTRSYSEAVAAQIDQEVKDIVERAYRRCEEILTANRKELELTARYLLEHETMDAATFEKVFTQPDGEEFSTLSQENV